jgi:predicted TIM-barrel fold metal-dependent hydrolase
MAFTEGGGRDASGCGCCLTRRGLFGTLAGAAALSAPAVRAQPARPQGLVDVHCHYASPGYIKALEPMGLLQPPMINWSLARLLDEMDKGGVARSLLSVTAPGIPLATQQARALTRESNEFAARLVGDNGGRLGAFAYLPLLDVEGSLKEIEYALDTLKLPGIGLMTSYEGKWLGDVAFDPVFEELNRRRAIVYVHPLSPLCCARTLPYITDAMIEYGTDTTRSITNYVYRGAARRFPNVRMIWSHAGGTMPFLVERYDVADRTIPYVKTTAPDGFRAEAVKFFYDVAQSSNRVATTALRQVVPPGQIVFGTDFPFRTPAEHVSQLENTGVFSRPELEAIYRGNVARALPALIA